MIWDLASRGAAQDGTKVRNCIGHLRAYTLNRSITSNQIQLRDNGKFEPCRIWELIPVKVDDSHSEPSSSRPRTDSSAVPPYEEPATGENCCTCSHSTTGPSDDGYGTTIIEVTTVTTRKKYRVED